MATQTVTPDPNASSAPVQNTTPQPQSPVQTTAPTAPAVAAVPVAEQTSAPAASVSNTPDTTAEQDGQETPDPVLTAQTHLALESAPYQIRKHLDIPNIKVYKADLDKDGGVGYAGQPSPISGVREGDTDKIRVYNPTGYGKDPNGSDSHQLPIHEAVHLVQNLMDKKESAKFPEIDKKDAYKDLRLTAGDLAKARKSGDTLWNHSREGQASIMQNYVARHEWLRNGATPEERHDYMTNSGQFEGRGNDHFERAYAPYLDDIGSAKMTKGSYDGSIQSTPMKSPAIPVLHAVQAVDGHPDMEGQAPAQQAPIPGNSPTSVAISTSSSAPVAGSQVASQSADADVHPVGPMTPITQATQDADVHPVGPMTPISQPSANDNNNPLAITSDPDHTLKGAAQELNAVGAGAGDALLTGLNGAASLFHLPHATLRARQDELEKNNSVNPTENAIGYGGETLTEFMMGDELLKTLSQADKLATVAKWMKIAEKSPRLMQALKFGATAAKAGTELSPEEAALIKQYPKLAKLVGLGIDAARAGAVQGGQTLARTGGDVTKAAEDAAGTAATAGILGAGTGAVSHYLGKGREAADVIARMGEKAASSPTRAAVEDQLHDAVHGAFSNETGTLQNHLNDATSTIGMFGEGAPQQSAITQAAQQHAKTGEQAVHAAYQNGLNQLTGMAGDATVPYQGSPLHKAAQELVEATPETAGPLDEAFGISQPASPRANAILDHLTSLGGDVEEAPPDEWVDANGVKHVEPAPSSEDTPPTDLTMQHLVARRQTLARRLRDLVPTSPDYHADRKVYSSLLEGIDNTIGQLADQIHDGEPLEDGEQSKGRQLFDQMNQQYREGIRPFQNKDVKNILSGNLNDVSKSIMGGQTSVADIADAKKALGADNFSQIGRASLQNIVQSFMDDSGNLDYKKLFSKFSKINPDVRAAMFGDQGKSLGQALKVATDSSNGMTEIGKQIEGILGNGNIDSVLKDPKQARAIANVVGPDGMKTLGRSILDSKIAEASTVLDPKTGQIKPSHFDPDKVLDWWMGMKDNPEVRDAFFSVDKDTAKHYNEMMQSMAQASSVKKLVKYGILPVTLGTAGVIHGPGAALMGAIAGLGTEAGFGRARDILDAVANNPRMWKSLGWLGKAAENVHKSPAGKLARDTVAAGITDAVHSDSKRKVYDAAGPALGGS